MSNEQIIETLENLQAHCAYQDNCCVCRFGVDGYCQIRMLHRELGSNLPLHWNIDRIAELLEK